MCDVTLFTIKSSNGEDRIQHPYKVVRCKTISLLSSSYDYPIPCLDKIFNKELENSHLDIVHIHSPFSIGRCGVEYAKKHSIPVIATIHTRYDFEFIHALKFPLLASFLFSHFMKLYKSCDRLYTVNEAMSKIFFKQLKLQEHPEILQNATDLQPLVDKKLQEEVNNRYNLEKDINLLLFVGRLTNVKNIPFIIRVLRLLKDKQYLFKMLFVGTGEDEKVIHKMVTNLKLDGEVFFAGKVMDREFLTAIYSRAKLLLFPSFADTNSLVQIEAASQRVPTIFLEGSPTSSLVTNNVNGFIVPNDEEAYCEKIIEVLKDEALYKKVSTGAYRDLYISWDKVVQNVYNLYLKLTNNL